LAVRRDVKKVDFGLSLPVFSASPWERPARKTNPSSRSSSHCDPCWRRPKPRSPRHHPSKRHGSSRGPPYCVIGLRRNPQFGPRPNGAQGRAVGPVLARHRPLHGAGMELERYGPIGPTRMASRSQHSSSMRARMVAKSSAARGRLMASPPGLVEFLWRSMDSGPARVIVGWLILPGKSRVGTGR
jgi:hypothetical protein